MLGANLGTTVTSWLVAVFGFKVKIATAAMLVLGLGAFLWMLARQRWRSVGGVLAGFGLLFIGIDTMQLGMAGVEWQLERWAGDGPSAIWLLAVIGAVMTIVMQSSSAAAATTLVALGAGGLTIDQAFALIIGQNIGTTATGALASFGAGLAVRRTALAHILFNLIAGIIALVAFHHLARAAVWLGGALEIEPNVLTVAVFHTALKLAGIILFFPWLGAYARAIEWMTGLPRNLLLGWRTLRKLMGGPEGGKKGVAGEKGSLGKAEMLKTEKPKGRMLRTTPGFGGIGRIHGGVHLLRAQLSRPLCQDSFLQRFWRG